jgi:hypothetical protein
MREDSWEWCRRRHLQLLHRLVTHMAKVIRKGASIAWWSLRALPRPQPVFQDASRSRPESLPVRVCQHPGHCSLVHMGTREARRIDEGPHSHGRGGPCSWSPSRRSPTGQRSALVIGGGLSGMAAALSLAEQGIQFISGKERELGSTARRILHPGKKRFKDHVQKPCPPGLQESSHRFYRLPAP